MSARKKSKEHRAAMATVEKAYRKKNGRGRIGMRAVGVSVFLLLIACLASVVADHFELEEKQQRLEELRLRAEQLETENAGYESILNEEDERTYMERIAIEKLGYAYPDERRFYDTTRN